MKPLFSYLCLSLSLMLIFSTSWMATYTYADALVVTKAMKASTIAEVFIDEESIRVDFEVGTADLASFQNLLPDEFYEKFTGKTTPLKERWKLFFEKDWIIRADGKSLAGSVRSIVSEKRIVRDEISGDPLLEQPEDAETVVRIKLHYPLDHLPKTISIRSPLKPANETQPATIGFMCYHNGLPVNDFRYLATEVTLDLYWSDAWYSQFRHRNYQRQFNAPMSVFFYVEPYEVRKEIVVRPSDLQEWIDLGLVDKKFIPVDQQEMIKKRVAQFFAEQSPVIIDGKIVEGRLDRIHFIHRSLRKTGIIEPPVDLDVASATLGVIYTYPVDQLPDEVTTKWELFSPKIQEVPAVASDEAGGLPSNLTPEYPELTWKNYLTNPTVPQLVPVPLPAVPSSIDVPILSVIAAVLFFLLLGMTIRTQANSRILIIATLGVLVGGIACLPFAKVSIDNPFAAPVTLTDNDSTEIMTGLLYNTYHAFDHHDEKRIYDRLSKSISGDLLSEVYLETRKSMEVKNQGGLQISVKEVAVNDLKQLNQPTSQQITFQCQWKVAGWIGHWGHIHRRVNQHLAEITIAPVDGQWKIVAMKMLDEQPLDLPTDATAAR
ncbi:MAG: hypothetical protein COA78_03870 [Blastopirellula sp.]|nr:MAG: hypothetical protein COA78_03870 [Blastopirellula sp.]